MPMDSDYCSDIFLCSGPFTFTILSSFHNRTNRTLSVRLVVHSMYIKGVP